MSTAGLEPARVSPHAPQTCAYTDSATSTSIFDFQMSAYTSPLLEMTFSHFSSAEYHVDINIRFSNVCVYLPSRKTIFNRSLGLLAFTRFCIPFRIFILKILHSNNLAHIGTGGLRPRRACTKSVRQSATSTSIFDFQQNYITINIIFVKFFLFPLLGRGLG